MKRSVAVSLVVMGAAVTLSACEKPVDTAVYSSVKECVAGNIYTADKCKADFAEASKSHAMYAPAFTSKSDCEAEFGVDKCSEAAKEHSTASTGSTSSFVPFMAGYMMSNIMGSSSRGGSPSSPVGSQALYKPQGSSNFMNSNGRTIANKTGPAKVSSSSARAKPMVQSKTLARGGFGARSFSAAG